MGETGLCVSLRQAAQHINEKHFEEELVPVVHTELTLTGAWLSVSLMVQSRNTVAGSLVCSY